jgi:hypothetical protein
MFGLTSHLIEQAIALSLRFGHGVAAMLLHEIVVNLPYLLGLEDGFQVLHGHYAVGGFASGVHHDLRATC